MKSLSREKLALLVFVVLVLGGLGVSLFYISAVSQPLNVAATNIDDATGNLNGYTAIVYKGLAEEPTDESLSNSKSNETAPSAQLNEKSETGNTTEGEATAADALALEDGSSEHAAKTVSEVRQDYREKGAAVFELQVENPEVYLKRSVLQAGAYTFAMIPIDETTAKTPQALESYIKKRVKVYRESNIDFVVLVVSSLDVLNAETPKKTSDKDKSAGKSSKNVKDAKGNNASSNKTSSSGSSDSSNSSSSSQNITELKQISLAGVDIVISTKDEGLNPGGALVNGVFYDDAVYTNQVGTLLISPSKVISAKDIS